ncbi:conserved hypothetical protein [Chthoniobacter flavus Ellin428]|uniref:Membrane-associated protein n=1 Tax=Chthoniobacter flavus Ellin428 TaxID=497964 RepID=B4D1U1_9BACT|nr:hypothetical protein [Chthoniobacter flavus]EDY19703.1 conserved hypothetical protein [Chthoniobacter flavus Ellin428]TCO92935.1 hypothetical protein EV701_105212 [Chthoniobacter flavus]
MSGSIPLWVKIAYTVFLAVLIPNYWRVYGPTNFLYFCDVAAFLTLFALWMESALLASVAAVGIVLPQILWAFDLGAHFLGLRITGMSAYMWNPKVPIFTRALSLFHGWLPFFLLYLVKRLGYDHRALRVWVVIACVLMLVCYFCLPRPGERPPESLKAVNINYVHGFSDDVPQHWMPPWAWLTTLLIGLPFLIWWPTHLVLCRIFPTRGGI